MNLYCEWCDKEFFDGEKLTWRLVGGGHEIPYHAECFSGWEANERTLETIFKEAPGHIESFERVFRVSQVAGVGCGAL